MFEEKIDSAYIKAFEQIRNIVEYEIPKLLCLFESLFQQAGKLLGYNMDDFNLFKSLYICRINFLFKH